MYVCTFCAKHCPPRPFRPVLRPKSCANDSYSQLPTGKSESLSCRALLSGWSGPHASRSYRHTGIARAIYKQFLCTHLYMTRAREIPPWEDLKNTQVFASHGATQPTYPCHHAALHIHRSMANKLRNNWQGAARCLGTLLLAFFQAGCDCHGARHIDGCKAHLFRHQRW